jgi:hypothetical protein
MDNLVDELFYQDLPLVKQKYSMFFNVEGMSKPSVKHLTGVGFEDWRQSGEAVPVSWTTNIQGFEQDYVPTVWKSGFPVTRELRDDARFKEVADGTRELARTAIRTIDKEAAKLFNNATSTTYFTGADGLALVSNSHTREDGGTVIDNADTGAFNETNLESALVAFTELVDGRGQLIDMAPNQLLVPPALEKEANILMKSTGRVATGNNDMNPYKDQLEVVVWPRLAASQGGSDTAWFLLDSTYNKSGKGLNILMRVNPEISSEIELETGVKKYAGYMRFAQGFTDFRGVRQSTGTA